MKGSNQIHTIYAQYLGPAKTAALFRPHIDFVHPRRIAATCYQAKEEVVN